MRASVVRAWPPRAIVMLLADALGALVAPERLLSLVPVGRTKEARETTTENRQLEIIAVQSNANANQGPGSRNYPIGVGEGGLV